ncbi:MAG TPA: hypothetical protein VN193_11010 [Candidatus Angelobacter sp.]|nr:hypothetical protein [Candidatus Angelobacter sp.]
MARPRVGIVLPGDGDVWASAVAARVLTLAVLDRVPRARVFVLVSTGTGAPAGAALDCGRPWRRLVVEDRQRMDVLLVVGAETKVSARGGCPVVRVPGSVVDVGMLAAAAGGEELRRNRVGTLRLLGWLPADAGTAHAVVDADADVSGLETSVVAVVAGLTGAADAVREQVGNGRCLVLPAHAGVDEVVAAVASGARYLGSHSMLAAIAAGPRDSRAHAAIPSVSATTSLQEMEIAAAREHLAAAETPPAAAQTHVTTASAAVDAAAAAALQTWHSRGTPGATPDPRPTRLTSTQHAALQVELRAAQRERDSATARAEHAESTAQLITGSRTWRYTERLRDAYHTTRRRLHR